MPHRYSRLSAGAAGGAKLCGRRAANPALTPDEAFDDDLFGRLLAARFGASDPVGDERYAYSIRDDRTGIEFKAYSATTGPAYSGSPPTHFIDFENNDYRVKPTVMRTLTEFETWLTSP